MIRKISTKKTWKNVLLKTGTQQKLDDVMEWLNQSKRQKRTRTKNRKQKPSLKLLFYGAPKRVKQTVAALRVRKQTRLYTG